MRLHRYDDAELKGLEISKKIQQVWASGRFTTVAEVTAEVHNIREEVPRGHYLIVYSRQMALPQGSSRC